MTALRRVEGKSSLQICGKHSQRQGHGGEFRVDMTRQSWRGEGKRECNEGPSPGPGLKNLRWRVGHASQEDAGTGGLKDAGRT